MQQAYSGFEPGGYFLTPFVTAHGVAAASYNGFNGAGPMDDAVRISESSLWIMFESCLPMSVSDWATSSENRDVRYRDTHAGFPRNFSDLHEAVRS